MDRTSEMSWGSLLLMRLASEVQTARDYFNTHFGLNFPELDANGRAQFENATMSYFQIPFTHYVTVNRWIYPAIDCNYSYWEHSKQVYRSFQWWSSGDFLGFCVEHSEVRAGESLVTGYYRVDACPQQPILIRYESINPSRSTADQYVVSDNRIYTRTLGIGFEIAVFRLEPNYNGNPS